MSDRAVVGTLHLSPTTLTIDEQVLIFSAVVVSRRFSA